MHHWCGWGEPCAAGRGQRLQRSCLLHQFFFMLGGPVFEESAGRRAVLLRVDYVVCFGGECVVLMPKSNSCLWQGEV